MEDRNLKNYLYHSLGQEIKPKKLDKSIRDCTKIVREYKYLKKEPRTSFFHYLSDVFRFEGIPIFVLQTITLFGVCLMITSVADTPQNIPAFMPLFVLAVIPVLFKSQFYGMSEIEAVTRASGAQIILAKLILAGGANLVCITIVLCLEVSLQNNCSELGQLILYCFVPYLACITGMLRILRLQRKESILMCVVIMLVSCVCWLLSARVLPWIYTTSAIGIWLIAFVWFGVFFFKEVLFIIKMRKEGKIYGIIA